MIRIAIFASGSGSNAQNIFDFFKEKEDIEITRIFCNNPEAYVLERARIMGVPTFLFSRKELNESDKVLKLLKEEEIQFIVLAGFLLKIPDYLIKEFPDRIINIHPALLPKYGGKGMYGMNVHQSVKNNGDTKTGITIHLVNEKYDEGKILFQAECKVESKDSVDTIAQNVHELEYIFFPKIIEKYILRLKGGYSDIYMDHYS